MSVVITGATGLLGEALVRAFAEYPLALATRTQLQRAQVLADGIRQAGGQAMAVQGDLAGPDRDGVARSIAQRAHDELGPITVLINNAADQSMGDWRTQSAADVDAIMAGTYGSVVAMSSAALPYLAPEASIITIASVEGFVPFPGHAHYAAAKSAVLSLTKSMASDLAAQGVRVNAIAPGLIDRPGLAEEWPAGVEWWSRTSPLGRPVTAAEVATVAYQLVQASGVSGSVLPVDGGWLGASPIIDVAAQQQSHQP
jgi:NAD(P)-dependent dehydrogenase (short-subunit alcohol dehydrogenase family)